MLQRLVKAAQVEREQIYGQGPDHRMYRKACLLYTSVDKVGLCGLGQLAVLKVLAVFVQHQQLCNDPAADLAHDEHIQPCLLYTSRCV